MADAAEAFAEHADDAHEAAQPPEVEPEPMSSVGGPGAAALRDLQTAVEALTEEAGPAAEPAAVHLPSAPEPSAPAEASSRVKTVREETFPVWRLGTIRYNPRSQTYTAFCSAHGEGCKRNRTCKAPSSRSSRPGQGRPLGQLLAWLKDGKNFSDAEQHVHGSTAHLDYESRRAARIGFLALEGAAHFARHERAKEPGESDEPRVVS